MIPFLICEVFPLSLNDAINGMNTVQKLAFVDSYLTNHTHYYKLYKENLIMVNQIKIDYFIIYKDILLKFPFLIILLKSLAYNLNMKKIEY